jgi:colanic acid biosynthesis glycosyl transferase WcaI
VKIFCVALVSNVFFSGLAWACDVVVFYWDGLGSFTYAEWKIEVKILVYGINFAPELTGIGKYSGEMVEWLVAQGHEVRVATAPPYYPEWCVGEGYSAGAFRRETRFVGGDGGLSYVVWRCPLWVPFRPGGLKRLLHLGSFAVSSLPVVLRQVFWRPDVVWLAVPALMCAPAAWLTARLCGAKAWLHVQDFEVDAAFDLGLLRGDRVKRLALWAERWVLRRFDRVSSISRRMVELARKKGVDAGKVVFFRNWVDVDAVVPRGAAGGVVGVGGGAVVQDYRGRLGIPADAVVALYAGNMGKKQGLEILPAVAGLFADKLGGGAVFFVFCGDGVGRAGLESLCKGLGNVRLLPLQPVECLGELLTMADIHLLPQRSDAADLVMPSKLTGMLASGRPVVASASVGTELAETVTGCGVVVAPDDAAAMAEAIRRLAGDAGLRARLGAAGRLYAERLLDRDAVLRQFEEALTGLVCEPLSASPMVSSVHGLKSDAD